MIFFATSETKKNTKKKRKKNGTIHLKREHAHTSETRADTADARTHARYCERMIKKEPTNQPRTSIILVKKKGGETVRVEQKIKTIEARAHADTHNVPCEDKGSYCTGEKGGVPVRVEQKRHLLARCCGV